ncbi:MAG: hypothetical protein WCG42_03010 [Parachlamydiaceae bacterium]
MANTLDFQDIRDDVDLGVRLLSSEEGSSFFDPLVGAKTCGLFLFMDKLIQKDIQGIATIYNLLDILRNVSLYAVLAPLPKGENVGLFVNRLLDAAENIALTANNKFSPLYDAATKLTESLNIYKQRKQSAKDLVDLWEDFLVHFYRENLYKLIA